MSDNRTLRLTDDPATKEIRNVNPLRRLALLFALATTAFLLLAGPAAAEGVWWKLSSGTRPTYIDPAAGTNESDQLTVTATGGTFTLNLSGLKQATAPLAFNASAATIQSALQALPAIGSGNVEVSGGPAPTEPLTITFTGALASRAVPTLTADASSLKGPGHGASIARLVKGLPDGVITFNAENVGDQSVSGAKSPIVLADALPPGLEAIAIKGSKPARGGVLAGRELLRCSLAALTCTLEREAPSINPPPNHEALVPYGKLEMRIAVNVTGPVGEPNQLSVSGGEGFICQLAPGSGKYNDSGCTEEHSGGGFERSPTGPSPTQTLARPIIISSTPVPFGVEDFRLAAEEEGGVPATQAGSHPFQLITSITLNQTADLEPPGSTVGDVSGVGKANVEPAALPKDVHFHWPPGLIGNPTPFARCTDAQFFSNPGGLTNRCPPQSAVGVTTVFVHEPQALGVAEITLPLFNLTPRFGEPARVGFNVVIANSPVTIDTSLRSGGDYGIDVEANNITQTAAFLAANTTVWGVPGDPRHDRQRGWACMLESRGFSLQGSGVVPCLPSEEQHPPPFLSMPTSCQAPQATSVDADSWVQAGSFLSFPGAFTPTAALSGCNRVPFAPQIAAEPTSDAATSPTGLSFDINVDDEGQRNPEGLIQSQIKKAVVSLPQGFTTNPSVAEGLHACPQADYESSTVDGSVACPENSKIGDVEIESPLATQVVHGSLYVAKQGENPNDNNLLTIYMVARNPELGVIIKQALKVVPDPVTGQLTTEVDNIPQLPFSHFHLEFRSGQRSPLITPPACGIYAVQADLYPYSNPNVPVHRESSFQITQGPEGQPCPSGNTPPFHPLLEAGTLHNTAGSYSPFYTHITRKDSEQEITHFSIKLPPGVIGKLAGVSECSDAAIAQAKSKEVEGGGTEEENSPSCPKNSEVGHSLVGSGVGNVLAYAPGKLYLAGPYHGSNLSLVSITAAKVGPFDLGTVVVRFALKIDPETAEVSVDGATSDPIPHIVDGIPVHLRDIRAYVDRPQFVLNPTSCKKTSTASTVLGSGLNFASEADDVPVTVTSPFQAADCASLGFAPKLALSLKGGTKRGATPAFKAVLTYPKGSYANIAESQVTLPHSEFLEQSHIGTVCTRAQFKEGKVPGEKCPAASVYGKAEAITPILSEPLKGPVYLRSSSHNLPDLVAALHNRQVDIALDGRIDSVENGRIRNTFEAVPDAPVSKFVLEMQGGKKGLLVNSTDICRTKHKAISHFVGQNGKVYDTNPVLSAKCGGKAKKKGSKSKRDKRATRAGR